MRKSPLSENTHTHTHTGKFYADTFTLGGEEIDRFRTHRQSVALGEHCHEPTHIGNWNAAQAFT